MKKITKILSIIITLTITTILLINNNQGSINANTVQNYRTPAKVAVVAHSFDPYISLVKQNLEQIQKENNDKVEFTFWDADYNQKFENEIIDIVLKNNVDLILLNLVDTSEGTVAMLINKIQQNNIPIIFFQNSEPAKMDIFKFYPKAYIVVSDSKQAGALQGKIIVDEWNKNKAFIDRNHDDVLQYILLKGPRGNEEAKDRTEYVLSTINNAGIKTQELASHTSNWNKDIAKTAVNSLFLTYGDKIEAIISNNDAMAIGAIEALQTYGYNKGDKSKTILIVGIDAIPEAKNLIKKGFMTGTVIQDSYMKAQALYALGMNLINNKNPIEGTNFKLYNNEKMVLLPFHEYKNE